jgi:hypothetical protein
VPAKIQKVPASCARTLAHFINAWKWLTVKRNLQPKDLVLLLDERLCREQWPLGIVEEVYPDKNGRVRLYEYEVLVRTSKSKFKRDIRKLCLLEGDC